MVEAGKAPERKFAGLEVCTVCTDQGITEEMSSILAAQ